MKILFSLRHPGTLRNFASTIRELHRRGHQVHLEFMMQDRLGDGRLLWELTTEHDGITHGDITGKMPSRLWLDVARAVRFSTDYARYETPTYARASALRDRAARRGRVPSAFPKLFRIPGMKSRLGMAAVTRMLEWMEAAIPPDPGILEIVRAHRPDIVLVTPLVDIGSDQVEYIKAAQALGIPCALCVHSWDNLTNKGLMRVVPDKVFVWNDAQKHEAVAMHRCRPDQVVVTGAPTYDQWFARTPSTTREEFCAKVGLRADRPFFLYLCSSQFIAPDEVDFIAEWVVALKNAPDPRVRAAGILIRPHPENFQPWQRFDTSEFDNVVVYPREGANPVDAGRKNDYYDSMYHAAAAVGINTSAQIESGIVGRPVYSIRVKKYEGTQEGTLHFHYLLNQGDGGLLTLANDLTEHARQLSAALDRTEADAEKLRAFIKAFVRPNGLEAPATPIISDGIEALGRMKVTPHRTSIGEYLMRALLSPVAFGIKATRQILRLRLPKKRKGRIGTLSVGAILSQPFVQMFERFIRWTPVKKFARRQIVPRVVPPQMLAGEIQNEQRVAVPRLIKKMSGSGKAIVVGPWLNDVGTEILCWIPFLNWVKTQADFPRDRLTVVSRGGVSSWYKEIGGRYIDLLDFYTPDQFRARNEQRLEQTAGNQLITSGFDRDIMKSAQQALGTRETEQLHPRYMYRLLYPAWGSPMSLKAIDEFTTFQPLPAVDASELDGAVPDDFVAVRFAFNDSFPDSEENRQFVAELIETLSETSEIVLLNSGLDIDHLEVPAATSSRVHSVAQLMTPRTSLDIQTKVITRARAFVGSYGGLSYLPPFYGVRALAFYGGGRLVPEHFELVRRAMRGMPRGSYVAMDVHDLELVQTVLRHPQTILSGPSSSRR
jgi:hypothetical protein